MIWFAEDMSRKYVVQDFDFFDLNKLTALCITLNERHDTLPKRPFYETSEKALYFYLDLELDNEDFEYLSEIGINVSEVTNA